ncbi:hypothetical protein E4U53_007165 [Claviceps sorghi]|nr:hypothetical protein E4U53_007165 [Claviceps sorghi]
MTASNVPMQKASREVVLIKQYKKIVLKLLDRMGYDYKQGFGPEDTDLRRGMEDALYSGNPSQADRQAFSRGFEFGYDLASTVYSHVPLDARVLIGRSMALSVYAEDDIVPEKVRLLQQFNQKLLKHETHGDEYFDQYARLLTHDVEKLYGPFATSCIVRNFLAFVASCAVECQHPSPFSAPSGQFHDWMRRETGLGDGMAFMMFPDATFPEQRLLDDILVAIPDIADWTPLANDVLSFYKERVVGNEQNGFISNKAASLGVTEIECLEACARRVELLHDRITEVFSANEELTAAWKSYKNGYIMFHVKQARYKLKEFL